MQDQSDKEDLLKQLADIREIIDILREKGVWKNFLGMFEDMLKTTKENMVVCKLENKDELVQLSSEAKTYSYIISFFENIADDEEYQALIERERNIEEKDNG